MKKWSRRLTYLIITVIWLAIMLSPLVAVRLATNGRMEIGNTTLFLIQERDTGGIGFQTTREVENEAMCTYNAVRFLMWEGEGENTRTCSCSDGVEREPRGRRCVAP